MTPFTRPTACWFVVLLPAVWAAAADPADDVKRLQGTWRPVKAAVGDSLLPPETLAHIELAIDGSRYVATVGESVDKGSFKIDPSKSPKSMDLVAADGATSGKTTLAVYELEGDTLTICYSLDEGVRPTELKTGGSMQRVLVTYRRQREL
jgi:uncharacterized protein (TIGR03067 family)